MKKKYHKPLLVIGASGHAKSIFDIANSVGRKISFFIDPNVSSSIFCGVNVLSAITHDIDLKKYEVIVAVGDNQRRRHICKNIMKNWPFVIFSSLVHSTAYLSNSAKIGNNTVVMANAVIGPDTTIGFGNIINTGSTVDHECNLGNYVSIAPGVNIGGKVTIEDMVFVGIGAKISNNITVRENSIIGAGALVLSDTEANTFNYGIPAKLQKRIVDDN
jgi:sugar O-acyltransferase (sialic acid O-acetyltransferase NeuD family)